MGKLTSSSQLNNISGEEDIKRFITIFTNDIFDEFNGRIDFINNIQCSIVSATFLVADQDLAVQHGLGYIPNGYIAVGMNIPSVLYDGTLKNTTNLAYLKANVITNAKIMFF